ncbi:MAG TPA: S53 family peptidase [Gaiellaceae bacterium]|nr:S53 family peptidase [Gaiellaceae bacterium]
MPDERDLRPNLVPLSGSERSPVPGAERVGDVDPRSDVDVTIVVRRGPDGAGADAEDMEAVERFVRTAGMEVVSADAVRRVVIVHATAAQAATAFGVELARYEADGVEYRGREGVIHVSADVAERIDAVLGLDDRPQARMYLQLGPPIGEAELPEPTPEATAPHPVPLWPPQVAALYSFPTGVDGAGQTIGIIELGGGYRDSELDAYFKKVGVHRPKVVSVSVDKGSNAPGGDADGEVLLDIEVSGAIAPGATIVVYFADPSDRGFYDAISTAVHDTKHKPSVVSISWGGPESSWTAQARRAFDDVFADAATLGVTVLAAAGDHGAGDAAGDGKAHADFPASSPHVVACGGTTLVGRDGTTVSEVVWNDGDGWATGGGISAFFAVPSWQTVPLPENVNGTGKRGRGIPDVAGNADIASGYIVRVDGKYAPVGGTSAVAPLYAALTALLNESLGRAVGGLLPALYALQEGSGAFRDITSGNNSVPESRYGPKTAGYHAGRGWDACTGLGSIHGAALLAALSDAHDADRAMRRSASSGSVPAS